MPPASTAEQFVDGRVLVGFQPGTRPEEMVSVIAATGAVEESVIGAGTHVLQVPAGRVESTVVRLAADPRVRYAEPDHLLHMTSTPNDPFYPQQWGLHNTGQLGGTSGADVDAEPAWDVTTGSDADTVVVGVLDSGIYYTTTDLAPNMWANPGGVNGCLAGTHGYDADANDCDPWDSYGIGHGTPVAGVLGARGDNGVGVTGVAQRTSIMAFQVSTPSADAAVSNVIEATEWAVTAKAGYGVNVRILNASFGGNDFSQAMLDEINRAGANGILFVAISGNNSRNVDSQPIYPCSYQAATKVCVGGTDQDDNLIFNYGVNTVDLAAPAGQIYTTGGGDSYGFLSGTSEAAPFVSGAAALILSIRPDLPVADLKAALLAGVDVLPSLQGKIRTGGRLNVCRALQAVASCTPSPDGIPPEPTTTTVISSLNPSTYGQAVTFSATVTSGAGIPTGIVTFSEGGATLGTASLNGSGVASSTTPSLSGGTHSITALYGGDGTFGASASSPLTQTVNQATSSTALTSSPNPSTSGQDVTLTAIVSSSIGLPTGNVTFKDGATTLGTGLLNGTGRATLVTPPFSLGPHSLTAEYPGDTNFLASSSPPLTHNVNLPSVSISDVSVTEPASGTAGATFTVSLSGPSDQPVSFAYSTADGSARNPFDYASSAGPLSFTPGQTSRTITIPVKADSFNEGTETFVVNLTNPTNAVITDNQGVATIFNRVASESLLSPYPGFGGGVHIAEGDLDADGVAEIVTGAGPGGGPHVRVFRLDGTPIGGFFAYAPGFTGGVDMAVCDTNGDGINEIVTGAGPGGGPHVRVFRLDGTAIGGFFAYDPSFPGGVSVSCANLDGAPGDEIVTGAGPGGGPHVRVFRPDGTPIGGFFAYISSFTGGVDVAAGDLNGDGVAEIVTGAGPGGGPHVMVFRSDGVPIGSFFAYATAFTGGVRVSVGDTNGDGTNEIITGAGPGGGPHVRAFTIGGAEVSGRLVFSNFTGGVDVAGSRSGTAVSMLTAGSAARVLVL